MEIRVLKYFLAITEEGSISAASSYLHVSQPSLSRQLMDLEKELGSKLFIRGNRNITLTEDGLFLKKRATEIIALFDKTKEDFSLEREVLGGEINIGGGETYVMKDLAKIATEFQKIHPDVIFNFFSGNADEITDRLDKGLLDFGVIIDPANISNYEHLRFKKKDTWGLLVPLDSPLAGKEYVSTSTLTTLPLILSRQSLLRDNLNSWLGLNSGGLNIVATYNLLYNASLLVEAGLGYALCIDKVIDTTGDRSLVFIPLSPPLESGLNVIWKKQPAFSRVALGFLKHLGEGFRD